jgi:hypothetical protein
MAVRAIVRLGRLQNLIKRGDPRNDVVTNKVQRARRVAKTVVGAVGLK